MLELIPMEGEHKLKHTPWALWTLITLNTIAFAFEVPYLWRNDRVFFETWGLVAGNTHWWQLVTCMFLHGDPMHLIWNMIFLWVFGDDVEDALGHLGFLAVYFLGGIAGEGLYVLLNDFSQPGIGASGGVSAVAGAYAVLFFSRSFQIDVWLLIIPIRKVRIWSFFAVMVYLGGDIYRTFATHGLGTTHVVHGFCALFGLAAGALARWHGVMDRYHKLDDGHGWWGYLPPGLVAQAQREAAQRRKLELEIAKAPRDPRVHDPWGSRGDRK